MIQDFVVKFDENRNKLAESFRQSEPDSYDDLVRSVVSLFDGMDVNRITRICHGDYSGSLVYVIGERGYSPETYWYVQLCYGSCSVCDAFCAAQENTDKEERVRQYMLLALHVMQNLKEM